MNTFQRRHLALSVAPLLATLWVGCADGRPGADPIGQQAQAAWTPLAVANDPLVRQPGSQPADNIKLESPDKCNNCHGGYNTSIEPVFNWQGSMMAQAARDFLFWSAVTVTAQDSIWAVGRPNATDICLRCHMPGGWLRGRSDPTNGSAMANEDFDGVTCDACHRMYDPFFQSVYDGTREGADWLAYWDETNVSGTPSQPAADATRQQDENLAGNATLFNGNPLFNGSNQPVGATYTENGSGQYFIDGNTAKRGSFADPGAPHAFFYSRYHKSRYYCGTCHDVSNPVLANVAHKDLTPGDGSTVLPSEDQAAYGYYHAERTFSEFMLSDYGQPGGAAGIGPFAPGSFTTSLANNNIARCQDCHMRDTSGIACDKSTGVLRPSGSSEHPKSGQPLHDMTGGNIWVSYVLASTVSGASNYDATNAGLLVGRAAEITMQPTAGLGIDAAALLAGTERAKQQLLSAASIGNLSYTAASGALAFRLQNQAGHKLPTGFPEGRRMFVNIKVYSGGLLTQEINPYDFTAGTLKGLPSSYSPNSPALGAGELHRDDLVFEVHPSSSLTGENETFHFALATGRYKDNRIPPKGFRIAQAAARLAEPRVAGSTAPGLFSAAEYAGGYRDVTTTVASGADQVVVSLYYQVTSREYVEFLRDEINGPPNPVTLPTSAYIAQTDPFFGQLRAWGDTIWQLWSHNKSVPGAAPFLMTQAQVAGQGGCSPPVPNLVSVVASDGQVALSWSDEHGGDASVLGYKVFYDQAGKAQLITSVGKTTSYNDGGLTNGTQVCYKVASRYAACDSGYSNVLCATPAKKLGQICSGAQQCQSGYCVDGVCCDAACGGGITSDCQACSTVTGAQADGTCAPLASGTICRTGSGLCDVSETCDGASVACPVDGFKAQGTGCRASAGPCDVAETCSGVSASCPADLFKPQGTSCRTAAGECDLSESCSGSAAGCPPDGKRSSGSTCRPSVGLCDAVEVCDGVANACPPDLFSSVGTICRGATGECDAAEQCTGTATACPADGDSADGTPCTGGGCQGGICVSNLPDAGVADSAPPADAGVADSAATADTGVADSAATADTGVGDSAAAADTGVADSAAAADAGVGDSAAAADAGVADSATAADQGADSQSTADGPSTSADATADDGGAVPAEGGPTALAPDQGCSCALDGSDAPDVSALLMLLALVMWRRRAGEPVCTGARRGRQAE